MRGKRTALVTLLLVAVVVGAVLWLQAQQRQYALNRQLIAALMKGDDGLALALVNAGADPNTRYAPTPALTLLELVKQLIHRSAPPTHESPNALFIVCGAWWDDEANADVQDNRPDAPSLVRAMLTHGADVNAKGDNEWTPLFWAVRANRHGVLDVLFQHGALVDAMDNSCRTALFYAVILAREADPRERDQYKATIRQLIAHGANPNIGDGYGGTPLSLAKFDSPDLVALMRQGSAKNKGK